MRQTWWKKMLSTALSLVMCGGLMAPAFTGNVTAATDEPIKIACIGDSITAVSVDSDGAFHDYIRYLQAELGDGYTIGNFGLSGITLNGYTGTGNYQKSLAFEPDIVTIMLGTNDSKDAIWSQLSPSYITRGDQYEAELRNLVQTYQNLPSHPTVYIATSPTAHSTAHGIREEILHNEIAPIQRKVAADLGCPLIEVHDATANTPDVFWDGIHPTEDGCALLGSLFADKIKEVVTTLDGLTLNGAVGVVDNKNDTVTVTLPAATDVTSLEPALTLPAGAAYTPTGPQDFTNPVIYTVTAADGTNTRDYTVTVNLLDKIKIACVGDSMTAATNYPNALEANLGDGYEVGRFGQNSTTVQKDGLKENGANPNSGAYMNQAIYQQSLAFQPDIVLLMLGANDSKQGEGQTQNGHNLVTNWKEDSPERYEADLIELVNSYLALDSHPTVIMATSPSGYTVEGNWAARPEIVNSQIAPIQRKVASELGCFLVDFNAYTQGKEKDLISGDGLHPNSDGYNLLAGLYYAAIQDALAAIRGFSINGEPGLVSQIDKTVYVILPDGTDLTALTPTMTLSDGAVVDKTGPQNFGQPVTYTVTAANGHTVDYTATVTSPSGVTVAKIEMLTMPEKTQYELGVRLDTTGASINVIYTDGARETVAVTEDMVSGYDWLTVGKQTLTVTYEGKTATYTVQVIPHGVVGSFSNMCKRFQANSDTDSRVHPAWRWADKYPFDASDGAGNPNPNLSLEMDITFGSEQEDVDFSRLWSGLTIKLRSTDRSDDGGDSEHNYGWNFSPNDVTDANGNKNPRAFHISIPLTTPSNNSHGQIDWSSIDRLYLLCYIQQAYLPNYTDHYMDIQNVYIIDNTQIPTAPDTTALQAAITAVEKLDTESYTDETVAVFERTLALAESYLTNPYALAEDIAWIIDELQAAAEGLEEKTVAPDYTPGDVDGNGKVEAADALMALQAATSKIKLGKVAMLAANVDGQGDVTASDALLILQYATQKIGAFPSNGETPPADPDPDPVPDSDPGPIGQGSGAPDVLP